MKFLPQYKNLTAVVLLLLQVFISTPVQFYHYHKRGAVQELHQKATVSEVCPICDHHYASYYDDFVLPRITPVLPKLTQEYIVINQALFTMVCLGLSNKSPPVNE